MTELQLKEFNVFPLTSDESEETNGGFVALFIAGGLAAGLIISAIDHWPDIKRGVTDAIADYWFILFKSF